MDARKDLKTAFVWAAALLAAGIVFYALSAYSAKPPEKPIRIMFENIGGAVLFSHQKHTSASGYGTACQDCHHPHGDIEDTTFIACGTCHATPQGDDEFPKGCFSADCHESPEDIEGTEVSKRDVAFHDQCRGCHDDIEAGPGSGSDECRGCHMLL